jgi:hypothetical protein
MEAGSSSESMVTFYQTARCDDLEDGNVYSTIFRGRTSVPAAEVGHGRLYRQPEVYDLLPCAP